MNTFQKNGIICINVGIWAVEAALCGNCILEAGLWNLDCGTCSLEAKIIIIYEICNLNLKIQFTVRNYLIPYFLLRSL